MQKHGSRKRTGAPRFFLAPMLCVGAHDEHAPSAVQRLAYLTLSSPIHQLAETFTKTQDGPCAQADVGASLREIQPLPYGPKPSQALVRGAVCLWNGSFEAVQTMEEVLTEALRSF